MKILLTGVSSFTGFWFANELSDKGHDVIVTFTKDSLTEYEGIRKERVSLILNKITPIFGSKFGDSKFIDIIKGGIDLLCHHGSDVTDYRSPSFNIAHALNQNTNNISGVIDQMCKNNCNSIIYTGSVFENDEGSGTEPLKAFSPYGLSKNLTYQIFKYYCSVYNIKLGKFVIANPFGPFEEFRFTSYLIQNWFKGSTPQIKTPSYKRDNIPVDLLAKSYEAYIKNVYQESGTISKINPSGYTESQGEFTKRFASEMEKRLRIKCDFELLHQTDFSEPLERINTESVLTHYNWNENKFWDKLAAYYSEKMKII